MNMINYKLLVKKGKESRYLAYIPELALFEHGDDLLRVVNKLQRKKEFTIDLYKKVFPKINFNHKFLTDKENFNYKDYIKKVFFQRFLILCLVAFFLILSSFFFTNVINHHSSKIDDQVYLIFNTTPKRRSRRIIKFKKKLEKIKPYIQEVKRVLNE